MALGLVFTTACDPLDDINADIDSQDNPVVGDDNYVLTTANYTDAVSKGGLGLSRTNFSSENDAKTMLPAFLTGKYPVWGKGSSVLVEYNLYIGNAFKLNTYNLNQADYDLSGSNLLGFQSDATPEDYLAGIVTTNVSNPKEGDYALAKYFQFTGSAYVITPKVAHKENFDYGATAGNLTAVSSGSWTAHSGAGNGPVGYATSSLTMANYPSSNIGGSITISSSGSEDVNLFLDTPITSRKVYASALVNLSDTGSGGYFFHLMTDGTFNYTARVGTKDDGSGKILFGIGASSSTLTYGTTSYELNTTYLLVSSYDIETGTSNLYVLTTAAATEPSTPEATNDGYSGNVIDKIAIRQGSTPTATIDGIRVANTWSSIMTDATLPDQVIGDKTSKETFYTFNGSAWEVPTANFYSLTEADFASMGLTNFGSSTPQDDYLPTFLGIKFPYAKDGDVLDVMYNYVSSSSGAQTRGNLYTFTNGAWVPYQSTISTTLQFGHDGTTWVPDNTIKYTLAEADYDYIAAQLTGNPNYANVSLPNLATYNDFDYNWKPNQLLEALGILADYLNPTAEEGQKYLMNYLLYDNGINVRTMWIIKKNGVWVLNE